MLITKQCKAIRRRRHISGSYLWAYLPYARLTNGRVYITSEAFKSKMRVARHKMVYTLLEEDLERPGGIHALQLKTQTPEEDEKEQAREREEAGQPVAES